MGQRNHSADSGFAHKKVKGRAKTGGVKKNNKGTKKKPSRGQGR